MKGEVFASGGTRLAFGRDQRGFGMVELLAAMTIMLVGILAIFALFQSGVVQLRRASTVTTAGAIADGRMERLRAMEYASIGLDATQTCPSGCSAADATYRADTAYSADTSPTTTMSASATATQTEIAVASASGFPATGEFRVKVDSEILLVTAGTGTTTWTVKRGQDGTTAATHNSGATVTLKQRVDVASCSSSSPPCTTLAPTTTVTGADGRSYRVDTYIGWTQVSSTSGTAGRALKQVTVVVRDFSSPYKQWARVTSIFDESTGL
jgi:prepilin-type N-terminal cleavage/methylation domain-containing protein